MSLSLIFLLLGAALLVGGTISFRESTAIVISPKESSCH